MKFKNNDYGERVLKFKDHDGDRIEVKAFTTTLVFHTTRPGEASGLAVAMDRSRARKFAHAIIKELSK